MDFLRQAFIAVISVSSIVAYSGEPEPPWRMEFTYHHWQMLPFVKTAEDHKLFDLTIKPQPDNFKVQVKAVRPDLIQIEAMGKSVSLAYNAASKKFELNGHDLKLSSKSSFADIHKEIGRILQLKKDFAFSHFLLPEAQAFPFILVPIFIGAELYIDTVVAAIACEEGRSPGGLMSFRDLLYSFYGPVAVHTCMTHDKTLHNINCPTDMKKPIVIHLHSNTMEIARDEKSGEPLSISVTDETRRLVYEGKVTGRDSANGLIEIKNHLGNLYAFENEVKITIDEAALYCMTSVKGKIEKLEENLVHTGEAFPEMGEHISTDTTQ